MARALLPIPDRRPFRRIREGKLSMVWMKCFLGVGATHNHIHCRVLLQLFYLLAEVVQKVKEQELKKKISNEAEICFFHLLIPFIRWRKFTE